MSMACCRSSTSRVRWRYRRGCLPPDARWSLPALMDIDFGVRSLRLVQARLELVEVVGVAALEVIQHEGRAAAHDGGPAAHNLTSIAQCTIRRLLLAN